MELHNTVRDVQDKQSAPCSKQAFCYLIKHHHHVDFACDVRIPFEIAKIQMCFVQHHVSDTNISNASNAESDIRPLDLSDDQSNEPSSGGSEIKHISKKKDVPSYVATILEDVKMHVFQSNLLNLFTKYYAE